MSIRSAAAAAFVASTVLAPAAFAEVSSLQPRLVKDIDDSNGNSNVNNLSGVAAVIGNTLYFRFRNGATGVELYETDGTADGTVLIKDIRTGTPNGFPQNLEVLPSGKLIFNATTGTTQAGATGAEVWISDGTSAGTQLLKDINPGLPSSNAAAFVNAGGTTFFVATAPGTLDELYKTDGTAAGTVLVKDIHPAQNGVNYGSAPSELTPVGNGRIVFGADERAIVLPNRLTQFDRELFVSDGTESGTRLVADINPGADPSTPANFRSLSENVVLFTAFEPTAGTELYRTDGTTTGTFRLTDINAVRNTANTGTNSSSPQSVGVSNGIAYFNADDGVTGRELYRSDGTEAGTFRLADLNAGAGASNPAGFTAFAGKTYFAADSGTSGRELFVTDGSIGGTTLLKEFLPGTDGGSPIEFTVVGDHMFFTTLQPIAGTTLVNGFLWETDGTADGTLLVAQTPGPANGYGFYDFNVVGNTLYYIGAAGLDANGVAANYELFAVTVPEPAGLGLLAIAGATLLRRVRRA